MSWIPAVEHHYPEPDTDVLVVMQDDTETWTDTAYRASTDGNWRSAGGHVLIVARVLYWQPYPPPPETVGRKSAAGAPSAALSAGAA